MKGSDVASASCPQEPVDVAAWRKAMEGVSLGPWTMHPVKGYRIDYVFSDHPSLAPTPENPNRHMVADCDCGNDSSDARWIARCSPTGIAPLLDEIERLQALENSPVGLADAHSKSPSRPAMPKEEDTHG